MTSDDFIKILSKEISRIYANPIINHHRKLSGLFLQDDYEGCISQSGKFVEAVLKGLWFYSTEEKQKKVNVGTVITGLQNIPKGQVSDSIRILLPRVCRGVYYIASDRGARHDVTGFDANKMDAVWIQMSCSYIMAEMIRVFSFTAVTPSEAQILAEDLVRKQTPLVFSIDGKKRILDTTMTFRQQTLCLLSVSVKSSATIDELVDWTEHSNKSIYKRDVLKRLHKARKIELTKETATLTPTGESEAKSIISNSEVSLYPS